MAELEPQKPVILNYRPLSSRAVRVSRCRDIVEAELQAGLLRDAGIACQIVNMLTPALGAFAGGGEMEILVGEDDEEDARGLLEQRIGDVDNLEPVQEPADAPPLLDETGQRIELEEIARFDRCRLLMAAATALASVRIETFLPALSPRGEKPRGTGQRFVLRVKKEDVAQAKRVLEVVEEENREHDTSRCPICGAHAVRDISRLHALFSRRAVSPADRRLRCFECGHRWERTPA